MDPKNSFDMPAWKLIFQFILETRGEAHPVYDRLYKDETVEIRRNGQSGGVEVIRLQGRNPVVVFDKVGEMIRYHAEFRFLQEYLRTLAALILVPSGD